MLGRIGPGLIGLQVGALVVGASVAVVAYWISARISNRPTLALIVPVLLAMGGNISAAPSFLSWPYYFMSRWEERHSKLSLFGAGALTALSVLYLQDSGYLLAPGIAADVVVGWALAAGLGRRGDGSWGWILGSSGTCWSLRGPDWRQRDHSGPGFY